MKMRVLAGACLTALIATQASAAVVNGAVTGGQALGKGGVFIELSVPLTGSSPLNTVGRDTYQDPNLYAFNEVQNFILEQDVNVDILAGGGSGIIGKGTVLSSHYVFFDPKKSITQKGWVSFDGDILGVITSRNNLFNSDFLAFNDVTYRNPALRGLEPNTDIAWILANDATTLGVDWKASSPGDYVRVLTAVSPVPLPAAAWLFLSGLAGMFGVSRKKKAKTA